MTGSHREHLFAAPRGAIESTATVHLEHGSRGVPAFGYLVPDACRSCSSSALLWLFNFHENRQ